MTRIQSKDLYPTYYIIGDGETEDIYFNALKEAEKPIFIDKSQKIRVNIKTSLPAKSGKGNYDKVFQKALEIRDLQVFDVKKDKIYCIIDYDVVISEQRFQQYNIDKKRLEKKGVIVVECNPCFEIWYLLHFQNTTKVFENCDKIATDLKKIDFFKNYHKTTDYYAGLKPYLQTAVKNAEILMKNDEESEKATRCEIQQIIHALQLINK